MRCWWLTLRTTSGFFRHCKYSTQPHRPCLRFPLWPHRQNGWKYPQMATLSRCLGSETLGYFMPGMYPSLFTSKFDIKLSCLLCIGIGWNENHATELTTQCFKGIRTATRICGGFLKWGIPSHHGFQWFQCSNGLILDDLGVPHDLGNLRTQWWIIIFPVFHGDLWRYTPFPDKCPHPASSQ